MQSYKFKIKEKISFPDHYNYKKNEIKKIILKAKEKKLKLVTTEKDFFRIKDFNIDKINYIKVDLIIEERKKFIDEILNNL